MTSYEDWTALEDSSQWDFKAYNTPFHIRGAVMSFLRFCYSLKDYNTKENSEQFLIPFLLQTSLSISYLLHSSMSKELFGEEKFEKKSLDIRDGGLGDVSPHCQGGGRWVRYSLFPSSYLPPRKYYELVFCLVRCNS